MRRLIAALLILFGLSACTPVMDPARWDPSVWCRSFPTDPICKSMR